MNGRGEIVRTKAVGHNRDASPWWRTRRYRRSVRGRGCSPDKLPKDDDGVYTRSLSALEVLMLMGCDMLASRVGVGMGWMNICGINIMMWSDDVE